MKPTNNLSCQLKNLQEKLHILDGMLANNQSLYFALNLLGLSLRFMHIYGMHVNSEINDECINQYDILIDGLTQDMIDGEFVGNEGEVIKQINDISKPLWDTYSDLIQDIDLKNAAPESPDFKPKM